MALIIWKHCKCLLYSRKHGSQKTVLSIKSVLDFVFYCNGPSLSFIYLHNLLQSFLYQPDFPLEAHFCLIGPTFKSTLSLVHSSYVTTTMAQQMLLNALDFMHYQPWPIRSVARIHQNSDSKLFRLGISITENVSHFLYTLSL